MPRRGRVPQPPNQQQAYQVGRQLVNQYVQSHNIQGSPLAAHLLSTFTSGIHWRNPRMHDIEFVAQQHGYVNRNWNPQPQVQTPTQQQAPQQQPPQAAPAPATQQASDTGRTNLTPVQVPGLPQGWNAFDFKTPNGRTGRVFRDPQGNSHFQHQGQQIPAAVQSILQPQGLNQNEQPIGPNQQQALNRQQIITDIVRNNPRRPGESNQDYRERIKPGIGAAANQLFGGQRSPFFDLPEDQRGPISLYELRNAQQELGLPVEQQGAERRPIDPRAREALNNIYNKIERILRNPLTPDDIIGIRDLDAQAQDILHNEKELANEPDVRDRSGRIRDAFSRNAGPNVPPLGATPEEIRRFDDERVKKSGITDQEKRMLDESGRFEPKTAQPSTGGKAPSSSSSASVKPVPEGQPPADPNAPQQPIEPRQQFLLDRMNALLGQIRRTGRRATRDELEQIRDIHENFGPITPAIRPQMDRIVRDFNQQAMLRNERLLGERPDQTTAQQLNVPVDAQGNVDINAYKSQFPHFFAHDNQYHPGGFLRESEAKQAIKAKFPKEERKAQMDLFKKIRSDINQVRWERRQGEVGYDAQQGGNRADEMARRKREDAAYRLSDQYRNVQVPEGLVLETAARQQPVDPYAVPGEEPFFPVTNRQSMQSDTVNRVANMATNPQSASTSSRGDIAPSTANKIQENAIGREHGRTYELLFGDNARLLQVPLYQPEQVRMLSELGRTGMEMLRRGAQPLDAPEQQQVIANSAIQSILNRLQNNDPVGAQQELVLSGGLGNIMALSQGQGVIPEQLQANQQATAQPMAYQPGAQGFVAPGLAPQGIIPQGGLAGIARQAANVPNAYQQGGGGIGGVMNAIQQGANVVGQGANVIGQAAQIPGQVRNAYQQAGGGVLGGLAAIQQGAGAIGALGQNRGGWEYGPAYGMQYAHPMPFTAANELSRFYGQTVPTLAERFTAAGGPGAMGAQSSAAFRGALGAAGRDLGVGLQSLREQYGLQQGQLGLQQQQQAFNQAQALREFAAQQRQQQVQNAERERQFQVNTGSSLLNPALQQMTSQVYSPAGSGVVPMLLNAAAQGIGSGVKAASMFA